jgi:hypothetical protein
VAALSYYAGYQQGFSDADEKAAAMTPDPAAFRRFLDTLEERECWLDGVLASYWQHDMKAPCSLPPSSS